MSTVPPGWYKDPADPTTQRWWDGEGWLGDPIPADATPPAGPPPPSPTPVTAEPVSPGNARPGPIGAPGGTIPTGTPGPGGPGVPLAGPIYGPPGATVRWPVGHPIPLARPRPHGFMLAGGGSRFMARVIDVLAVLVLAGIANIWFAIQFWRSFQPVLEWAMSHPASVESVPAQPAQRAAEMMVLMGVVLTAVWFAYEVPASANSGQTLGKKIFGIKVIRVETDERLGFGRSFRRWFRLAWPTPFWVACYGIPVLFQIIDCLFVAIDRRLHQALHDRVSGTVVVQVPRAGRPETLRIPIDANPASTGHPSNPTDRI